MNLGTVVILVCLLIPIVATAEVFRCTSAAGKVEYSDSPCVGGTGRTVIVNQNVLPAPATGEQVMRDGNQKARKEIEASKSPNLPPSSPAQTFGRTEADLAAEKGGSLECARAKRSYEVATSSIQSNRNTDADELAMYSACGLKPPDKTIVNITNVYVDGSTRPSRMTNCDRQACWDERGNRYQRGSGGGFFGPRGACAQVGSRLNCP